MGELELDNRVFLFIAATIVILVLLFGGKMCVDRFADRFVDHFSDTSRNIPFEEPVNYGPDLGVLSRGMPVFTGPFGMYDMGGRPYHDYGDNINTDLLKSLEKEGFGRGRRGPRYDPSWGGRFRGGPHYFTTAPLIPGDEYGPLPPGRRPFGGRCDCHYETGHIKYKGGKCYRPWGPNVDPRDSCYDLRNY